MAREIHDTLAQGFTGIILQLQVAESLLDGEEAGRARALDTARRNWHDPACARRAARSGTCARARCKGARWPRRCARTWTNGAARPASRDDCYVEGVTAPARPADRGDAAARGAGGAEQHL